MTLLLGFVFVVALFVSWFCFSSLRWTFIFVFTVCVGLSAALVLLLVGVSL